MYLFSSLYYCFKTSLKNILYTQTKDEKYQIYKDLSSEEEDYGFEFVDSVDHIV